MARTPGSFTKSHRVKNARQRAWNAMRIFKTFTLAHLETSAEVSVNNLHRYLKALHRAGYLRQARPKRNGSPGGHIIWRLVAHTGPLAPMVRRDGSGIYDPNSDLFIPWREEEPAHDPAPAEDRPRDREETADDRRNLA